MRMVRSRLAICALVFLLWQGLGVAGLSAACCLPVREGVTADDHACCSGMAPGSFCPMHARSAPSDTSRCRLSATCLDADPGIVMAWQAPLPSGPVMTLPRQTRAARARASATLLVRPELPPDRPPRGQA